ncbi:tRNA (guanosine(37)-N1)-methyltransferase TrmD [Candidatus Shapirobacteria bacterium CG08_land_8_20_14_0_20_39_18]|uniref:tRNA (guanine-N(1)-)-methyltransferase n=1 Tax=Candidatus Shapirobacteria bacterium CG08_land_8_20_14_0_20_39_18 TaxID=1974883 RepID=A0A2M6XDY1_9BACT|nr:MAG: tRNA (guanosine(37)-N1)-methyltransferase TrmD [Candidatus Shapirobacteria bacterium CG08_land_8_20_14_0_20_39_18]PJE68036.1 MAG: tRNA (guanosine(37)-N1)-methyltransferase TrmD [Candidatus Shapirobacteria bacterium CG10_big_fil_rev_8_21_14_0_10_38_8]
MVIDIITLFPEMFKGPFAESIVERAQNKGLVEIKIHNLRDWTEDKRKTVDDKPYGGGVGMVMKIEPIDKAIEEVKSQKLKVKNTIQKSKVILTSPRGKMFNQKIAKELSQLDHLIIICGHYEGVDERVTEHLIDEEISIGDYVLTGGEIPAMIMTDTIVRLIPGVLEKDDATVNESFTENLLENPQYTRPEDYKGWKVPEILLSGDHKKIQEWQKQESLEKTEKERPDLI